VSKQIEMVPPVDGYNIHLTIDEVIQSITEKVLSEICMKYNAIGGSITVMDPKTGDVLAMANFPVYDLNHPGRSSPETRRNRAVTDLFEPGSVFKSFTLAGILEERVVGLNEKFNCENGSWAVAGKVLHDHKGHGALTFREIIEKSSNIGTVKGAMRLGADKMYKTIKQFGFGAKTGIGLAGEVSGLTPHPKNWSRSSIINIPIGHGVAVTPIQLCAAIGAIANNGVLMKPRLVMQIDDQEGRAIQTFLPEAVRPVISKSTALQVRSVLEGVVSRGTGKKAAVPGFKAAGKTGTAQKILPDGTYSHSHFIASFIGFVPYDDPKLVISVSIDEPRPIYYGGEVAAPAFSKVASGILAYWQVSPPPSPDEVVQKTKKTVKKTAKPSYNKPSIAKPIETNARLGVAQ
jgi:cell division protein FtsI (penicillin-binding protein 3)